ncbi:MAG: sigma-70 family RNA polymerase sigma factor [Candidatus Omnitrophica bacterium]|nr:sigma-70 family RNA polymerase sigma factor [Candidatus Omnitrophota bacterium]MDD5436274.1 sigma-70 family RNA polymerase sigma factor [Candidatus Omnitrophota bacterium]
MEKKFERMFKDLSPTLRRITRKLNGHFTFFDEDDLFQEALEHLWIAYRNGALGGKTDSYVLQGCYFHLKNYIRKTMDRATLASASLSVDEDGPAIEDTLVSRYSGTEEAIDNTLLAESIERIGLSKREERVLSLLLRGMTVREIGDDMGVSHVMVVKIKNRIKTKCRALRNMRHEGYQN